MKKLISFLLIFTIIFSIPVFADEVTVKKEDIKAFEGIIITTDGDYQLKTSKDTFEVSSEIDTIQSFLGIVANNGIKVVCEGVLKDKSINMTYIKTVAALPSNLQTQYEELLISTDGLKHEFEKILIEKTNNKPSIKYKENTYMLESENEHVMKAINLFADTGKHVYMGGKLHTGKFVAECISPVEELNEKLLEEYNKIYDEFLNENQKNGVIISEGKDSYLLVEENTNKMYYLKTDNEIIRQVVPIIANKGQKVKLTYAMLSNERLNVIAIDYIGEMDANLKKELEAFDKKVKESTLYYIEGYIKKDKEDYNLHYEENNKEESIGIVTADKEVATVIKTLADKTDAKVKLEGYVNAEDTLIDTRKITLISTLSDETKTLLETAVNNKNTNNTPTISNSTNNNTTGTTNNNATGTTNNTLANSFNNLFNTSSSLFSNFDLSNFGNFGSLLGGNSTNNNTTGTTNNTLANGFNNLFNTSSSLFSNFDLSNFGNFGNLFGDTSTNSLFANFSEMFNTDIFANFNNSGLFNNLNTTSLFSGLNLTSQNTENSTSAFSDLNN